jgi:hypothetical protein
MNVHNLIRSKPGRVTVTPASVDHGGVAWTTREMPKVNEDPPCSRG